MQLPAPTTPLIQGRVIGAIACTIIGFTSGGWVTSATASKDAMIAAHEATVRALAPFCAKRFRAEDDASNELAKASTWGAQPRPGERRFRLPAGQQALRTDLARACVELLMAPTIPKT